MLWKYCLFHVVRLIHSSYQIDWMTATSKCKMYKLWSIKNSLLAPLWKLQSLENNCHNAPSGVFKLSAHISRHQNTGKHRWSGGPPPERFWLQGSQFVHFCATLGPCTLIPRPYPYNFWAHLCVCTVGSYASLSVCLSVWMWLDQNSYWTKSHLPKNVY